MIKSNKSYVHCTLNMLGIKRIQDCMESADAFQPILSGKTRIERSSPAWTSRTWILQVQAIGFSNVWAGCIIYTAYTANPLLLVGVFLGDSAVGKQQHHQVGEQIQAILRVSPVTWLVMNHHHIVPRQLKVQTMFCQELPRNQPGPASKFPSTAPGISELEDQAFAEWNTNHQRLYGNMEQVLVTGIGGFLKYPKMGVPTNHQSGCSILSG